MRLLADENFEPQFVELLRKEGHEVIYLAEERAGIPDTEGLEIAQSREDAVIANDKDVGELVFRHEQSCYGAIFVRLHDLPLSVRSRIVTNAIRLHEREFLGNFVVISENSVRIRTKVL